MTRFHTDLAMEAFDPEKSGTPTGVEVNRWEASGVTLTEVLVTDEEASRMLGKPRGRYLTMECGLLRRRDPDARSAMAGLLAEELSRLLPDFGGDTCALVVGLGNRAITPDALGPAVVERTLVTRHVRARLEGMDELRAVSAVAPGVLGVTGIETMDVVGSLVGLIRPAAVICVDSLAARDSARIGSTIQLTDSGIQPGAGVGNRRSALTRDSVGAPVIAVGMPMVVHASTLVRDALISAFGEDGDAAAGWEDALGESPIRDMIVTPREIDSMVEDAAGLIAGGINRALQPHLSDSEIEAMMN